MTYMKDNPLSLKSTKLFFPTYALQHERANKNSTAIFLKTLLSPIWGLNFHISLVRRTSGRSL